MREDWRPIKNYEELYEVSNLGRIRSIKTGKSRRSLPDRLGYARTTFRKGKMVKTYKWHRLVLETFEECPKGKTQVNHKNGNKLDNRLKNLEWVTKSENLSHAYSIGLRDQRGEKNNSSKLTIQKVVEIRDKLKNGESQYKVAKEYGVSQPTICSIKARKLWNY
jgi:hypothetical protein